MSQRDLMQQIFAEMCCLPIDLPLLEDRPTLHRYHLEVPELNALEPLAFDSDSGELYLSPIFFGQSPMKSYADALTGGFSGVPVDTAHGLIALLPTALLRRVQKNPNTLRGAYKRLQAASEAYANGKAVDVWSELDDEDL